nr:uncharacterized protein LOC104106124 [Nicotiana tomentosiformis]
MSVVARQDDTSYPYPNTITEYFTDARVDPRDFDTKSDETSVVAVEIADMPSTSVEPSTSATTMPPPSASVPSISTLKPVPMPNAPLSALQASQTLASLNNWMQTTTAKLSDISSHVATQLSFPAPQIPPTVEETLKKILENQNTIMATLVQHGSVIEELEK